MMAQTVLIEGGQVLVPAEAPWLADFQHEIAVFPDGRYDDQVVSVSQFHGWATNRGSGEAVFRIS